MSQEMETILRKSLDDVDRIQKWQAAGFAILLLLFLLHAFAFIFAVHGGQEGASAALPTREIIGRGILLIVFTVGFCTFGITFFISRIAKKILKAIELLSKP